MHMLFVEKFVFRDFTIISSKSLVSGDTPVPPAAQPVPELGAWLGAAQPPDLRLAREGTRHGVVRACIFLMRYISATHFSTLQ